MNTITLNTKTAMLHTALQEALDNLDMLRYLRLGALDVPAYIKQAADLHTDHAALDKQTVESFFDAMAAVDHFHPHTTKPAEEDVFEKVFGKSSVCHKNPTEKLFEGFDQWEAKQAENAKTFNAEVYIMPVAGEVITDESFCSKMARDRGALLGITFPDGPAISVLIFSNGDLEKQCWQNSQIPDSLKDAIGIPADKSAFAPGYLPLEMVRKLVNGDEIVLTPLAGVRIVLKISETQYQEKSARWNLNNVEGATLALYEKLAKDSPSMNSWYDLGLCHEIGCGSKEAQTVTANDCFKKSAELGSRKAELKLGWA